MISYAELESACLQNGLNFAGAEVHGILTGMLCANVTNDPQDWLTLIAAPRSAATSDNEPWSPLYQTTLSQLAYGEFEFRLMLPDDDAPLQQRTEALADWCRGFLYGISNGKLQQQMELSDNVTEIIEDLTQISRAGHDNEADDEAEEAAYMELVEYVRAGAMLIYVELQLPLTAPTDQTMLH